MFFITIFLGLLLLYYLYLRYKFSYFKRLGVPEDPGFFPLGSKSTWEILSGKLAFVRQTEHIYHTFSNEAFVGTYAQFGQPLVVVRDLELAKCILIKDFNHFVDRRPVILNRKANRYFADMLILLTGQRWKTMRNILSPAFTSGKLKSMMPSIDKVGDELVRHVKDHTGENNFKALATSYTLDVIAAVGLGIQSNSFQHPDSPLRQHVALLIGENQRDPRRLAKMAFVTFFPRIAKAMGVSLMDMSAVYFIADVIKSSLQLRQKEPSRRNDLIDIVLDALKSHNESQPDHGDKVVFSPEEIEDALVSNALLMLMGGFDTSSNGMSICAYFLAKHPDVQDRLYEEIKDAIEGNEGDEHLEYHAIQSLSYLDAVVHEALRMYPLVIPERLCVQDYPIQGSRFIIPKGTLVQITAPQILMDEKFYPNPGQFNPDRFLAQQKNSLNPYAYLVFGQGPRNCLGMRFALLQLKMFLVRMLFNFRLSTCTKTVAELIPDPLAPSMMPKGGIWVDILPR